MPRATGRPARSWGFPYATASTSPKPELTEAARAPATARVSAWVRYGVSAIVVREPPEPKIRAAVDGLIPGTTVSLRMDC